MKARSTWKLKYAEHSILQRTNQKDYLPARRCLILKKVDKSTVSHSGIAYGDETDFAFISLTKSYRNVKYFFIVDHSSRSLQA